MTRRRRVSRYKERRSSHVVGKPLCMHHVFAPSGGSFAAWLLHTTRQRVLNSHAANMTALLANMRRMLPGEGRCTKLQDGGNQGAGCT